MGAQAPPDARTRALGRAQPLAAREGRGHVVSDWTRMLDLPGYRLDLHGADRPLRGRLQVLESDGWVIAVCGQHTLRNGPLAEYHRDAVEADVRELLGDRTVARVTVVTFLVDRGWLLACDGHGLRGLSDREEEAVAQAADLDRSGAPDPDPEVAAFAPTMLVGRMMDDIPLAHHLFRAPCMAAGAGDSPASTARCCWYHSIPWPAASAAAAAVLSPNGHVPDTLGGVASSSAADEGARSLLVDPICIEEISQGRRIANGQHRLQAMRDQGVRWVPVEWLAE